ncbi:MAG: Fe-S cluster assembly protein SufB, partial [bacterium]|nr:Fe-S cluster assembly protein SufB [bacterium]
VHYIEGCTAPIYSKDSLHAAVVELVALEGAHIRYTTIQNWSTNVFNLVTKRAVAYKDAFVEWVDGNLGSKLTMKYPGVYLMGEGARGEVISIAYASKNQHQDTGAKMVHLANHTRSSIISKSVSKSGGRTSYRGLVRIEKGLEGCRTKVRCDALILDEISRSDTYPLMDIKEETAVVEHEAVVSKISDEQLFYLTSRGISGQEAMSMIVNGFIDVFARELPLEYAVELNRLIQLDFDLIPERVG